MWAVSPTAARPYPLPLTLSALTISSNTRPPRTRNDTVTTIDVKGLGRTILTALNSGHPNATGNPIPKQQKHGKQKQQKRKQEEDVDEEEEEEEGGPMAISGSDVLLALQRASAQKTEISRNKKTKKKKAVSSSSVGAQREEEEDGVDCSRVRPLCIKSEWGVRLDELEKRLQELLETH